MKKYSAILVLTLLAALPAGLEAAPKIGAFGNVRTGAARMPFYKNQQLEYFMRSRSMTMRGKLIDAVWPMIDSVQKGVSVEAIAKADNKSDVYPLNAPLKTVQEFWRKRSYSAGLVVTPSALFDQAQRSASGSEKVFMRSPMMDLNGVGFTADFNNHVIKIASDVQIVLRNSGGRSIASPLSAVDEKKSAGSKTEKITSTLAYCDEMIIDTKQNKVTLIGNVRIFDPAGTITCNRLEIEFGDEPATGKKVAAKKAKKSQSPAGEQKLRIARFMGKVHAVRQLDAAEAADGEQTVSADLMIYDAAQNMIEMTGSRPKLMRGNDLAEAERIVVLTEKKIIRFFDKCFFKFHREKSAASRADLVYSDYADWNHPANLIRLIGHAKYNSPSDKSELKADRIEITLADRPAKNAAGGKGKTSGKRPERSVADGNVVYHRNNNGVAESARAGRMTYNASAEEIHLENQPVIRRGNDVISGGEMRYNIARERMIVNRSSRITLAGATVDQGKKASAAAGEPVTVNSRSADLNYGGNKLAFDGNVAVRGRGMKLDSDKLDIDLKPVADNGMPKNPAHDTKMRKQPVRALAIGNVLAEDQSGTLSTGELDVRLGDKVTPGKVEVEKIFARNKMRLQSKPDKTPGKNQSTLLGKSADGTTTLDAERGEMDLLTNVADFYEKVVVKDSSVKLECEHLRLIARKTAGVVPTLASYKARDEFPDRLAVGDERELVKVIANKDVKIFRTLPTGEIQRAQGDQGIYTVKERKVVMTCVPPKRPQALTADSGMIGDRVMIELDSEELYVENGDVLTRLNDLGL